jgi:hypothetical protein
MDAWLGDTEVTDAQREAIQRAADRIDDLWNLPDDAVTREQALIGAVQVILGDDELDKFRARYFEARRALEQADVALIGALIGQEVIA